MRSVYCCAGFEWRCLEELYNRPKKPEETGLVVFHEQHRASVAVDFRRTNTSDTDNFIFNGSVD